MVKAVTFEIAGQSRSVFYTVTLSGKDLELMEILQILDGKAIKTKDLAKCLHFSFERNVGKILENLRMEGIPVIYSRDGVLLTKDASVIKKCCEYEQHRSKEQIKKVNHWCNLMMRGVNEVTQTQCCDVPKKPWYRKLFGSW